MWTKYLGCSYSQIDRKKQQGRKHDQETNEQERTKQINKYHWSSEASPTQLERNKKQVKQRKKQSSKDTKTETESSKQ